MSLVDDEEKKEIMSKLKEEHKETLKDYVSDSERNLKELAQQFCELYTMDHVKEEYGDDEPARINFCLKLLKSRLAREEATPTEEIEMFVIGVSNPSTFEQDGDMRKVGSCMGLGVREDSDKIERFSVTGWDEQSKYAREIDLGDSYGMNVSRQNIDRKNDLVEYNFESHTEIEETDFNPDNIEELLLNHFRKAKVSEAKRIASKDDDLRVIKAIIQDTNVITTKNDNKMMRYGVYDDSVPLSDIGETGLFSVFVDIDMAKFGPDSEVYFIGQLSEGGTSEDGTRQYKPSMFARGVVPILPIEYEVDTGSVDEEELEIEDADSVGVEQDTVEEENDFDDMF